MYQVIFVSNSVKVFRLVFLDKNTCIERSLPSFFCRESENRTPELYVEIRNWIMNKFHANSSTRIGLKDVSEISTGNKDVKQEIMKFLDYWDLINYHSFTETEYSILNIDDDEPVK